MKLIRVLMYDGDPNWVQGTQNTNEVKGLFRTCRGTVSEVLVLEVQPDFVIDLQVRQKAKEQI